MTKVTKNFVQNYDRALNKTLNDYLATKPHYANEAKAQLTIQFMIEYNKRLLALLKPYRHEFDLLNEQAKLLRDKSESALLLNNSETDCESGNSTLTYYQEVAKNIQTAPFKEYCEHQNTQSVYYARLSLLLAGSSVIAFFLFFIDTKNRGDAARASGIEPLPIPSLREFLFFLYAFLSLAHASISVGMNRSLTDELRKIKSASDTLQCFGQQKTYHLPNSAHIEPVENLKEWFENPNVFFQKSLAEVVKDNMSNGFRP